MVFKRKSNGSEEYIERHEAAVWLGRAMSTHEVSIRVIMQLLDAVTIQQNVIQALYEASQGAVSTETSSDALAQMEVGLSHDLLMRVEEVRNELKPILEMVDQSCRTLKNML